MDEEQLERIESKLAFLENANAELSDVVFRQQREIDALRVKVAGLQEELKARPSAERAPTLEEERPPHY